jgi:hypothetical protein
LITVVAGALLSLTSAQIYRLSGDALVLSRAPAGLIALGGDARPTSWVSAEALIWAGTGEVTRFDALVAAVRFAHPEGWGELSLGRIIAAGGALRPVHLDGARGIARAPFGTTVEAFGGVPVAYEFLGRGGDWLAGGRLAQDVLGYGSIGVSIFEQHDRGDPAHREVGIDLAVHPIDWLDLSARGAYDLLDPGISEVLLAGGVRLGIVRAEVYATHRSPSRILPATSIFSVLGDVPSRRAGLQILVRAAPRLDLSVSGGAREVDGFSEEVMARATLRLDDRGRGMIALEVRRDGAPEAKWFGARALARVPLPLELIASAELELVVPDESDRGKLWPWGLVALGWSPLPGWEVGAALEAGATPENVFAIDGLFRASYRFGVTP